MLRLLTDYCLFRSLLSYLSPRPDSGEGFNVPLQANQNFGAAVAELPDLDGDNVTELIVGSYVATNASTLVCYKNVLAPITESPPKVYAVKPALLQTAGGEAVTLYVAVDLTTINVSMPLAVEVRFGTVPCENAAMAAYKGDSFPGLIASTKQEPFTVTCTSDPAVGGNLPAQVVITQNGAEVVLSMSHAVSYQLPVVGAVVPSGSAAKGGFDVTITGSGFGFRDFHPTVFIHGTPCANSTWLSDTQVVCVGAPSGLGDAVVQVSVAGQISSGASSPSTLVSYDQPMVTSWRIKEPQAVSEPIVGTDVDAAYYFSPYTAGEELLQVFGSNFGPVDNEVVVALGPRQCSKAKIVSDGEIHCTTPAGIGSGYSVVVTIADRYQAVLPRNFSYGIPLVVTVVPEIANTEGGDMVIMGRNFGSFSSSPVVMIGDQLCTNVKVVFEHELLTCKYPPGTTQAQLSSRSRRGAGTLTGQTGSPACLSLPA